jgi:hypothetical protein
MKHILSYAQNTCMSSCNVPVIVQFLQRWNLLANYDNFPLSNLMKSSQVFMKLMWIGRLIDMVKLILCRHTFATFYCKCDKNRNAI